MSDKIIKLADVSGDAMHCRPVDMLKEALKEAEENPDYDKCVILLVNETVVPGEDDILKIISFTANLSCLEKMGLLAKFFSME